jgi:hypothetical protein
MWFFENAYPRTQAYIYIKGAVLTVSAVRASLCRSLKWASIDREPREAPDRMSRLKLVGAENHANSEPMPRRHYRRVDKSSELLGVKLVCCIH